jgi:Holliday junction resolvasome RuvABC endonuclease subunit
MQAYLRALGIDPSLRNTGFATVTYFPERNTYEVIDCLVLSNPVKYKGSNAIIHMLEMIQEVEGLIGGLYDGIFIESPTFQYGANISAGTLSSIAHISGGCAAIYLEAHHHDEVHLIAPSEWKGNETKEDTREKITKALGSPLFWGFEEKVSPIKMEHVIDAAGLALWGIKNRISQ